MATVRDLSGNNPYLDPHIPTLGGGGGSFDGNITQLGGNNIATGAGAANSGTIRVVIASDQTAIPVTGATGMSFAEFQSVFGAIDDAAWDGVTADPTFISMFKGFSGDYLTNTDPAVVTQLPYTDVTTLVADTPLDPPATGLLVVCTAEGDVSLTNSAGNTFVIAVKGGSSFFDSVDVSEFNASGTTATATIYGFRK